MWHGGAHVTAPLDLHAAIGHLASIDRASCSPGEQAAAEWIAARLRDQGVDAAVELERVHGTYWWPIGSAAAAGLVAAILGRRGHRLLGGALGVAAGLAVADDLRVGRRWVRRVLPRRTTANVVGVGGERSASRTVLLVSHHDAAHSGFFFNPRLAEASATLTRGGTDRSDRSLPLMVPLAAGPALAGIAALAGARRLGLLAAMVCAGIVATFADIAHRPSVPGANDNLTGVATLLGVAERLAAKPAPGIRVLFVSTGAEEALMEGMVAFAARHGAELEGATGVLCVDSVGSPELILPDAEAMLVAQRYDPQLRELVRTVAERLGIELRGGMTVHLGTDALVALRRGVPAVLLMSIGPYGVSTNYHWPTDTPDRVDYGRLGDAVDLCEAVVRALAAGE